MVPLSTLVTMNPTSGPDVIYRFNRYRAAELIGQTAPGFSSGQSAAAMEEIASKNLPAGFGYEWSGTVFQQKLSEGKEGFIFGFAAVLVFLFLAAQYESWASRSRSCWRCRSDCSARWSVSWFAPMPTTCTRRSAL